MKLSKDNRILIIGLGIIGGSFAEALSKKGYQVGAITLNQEDIDFALEKHYISSGKVDVDPSYISQFDVVIFALYPDTFISWLENHPNIFKKGTIITDVCGVKGAIVKKAEELLGKDVHYVSSHPMAGKEVYGVYNADASIFKKANFIITPTENSSSEIIEFISTLAEEVGFCHISTLSIEEHDEMIAFLSQLTHCLAVSLMTCKNSEHLQEYTGDSFRDLTRIANINDAMWSRLFILNKEKLLKEMDIFLKEMEKLRELIQNEDVEKMSEMMKLSTYRRSFFDKKS